MRSLFAAIALMAMTTHAYANGLVCYGEASAGRGITTTQASDGATTIEFGAEGLTGGVGIGCDAELGAVTIGALGRYDFQAVDGKLGDASSDADAIWMLALRAGVNVNKHVLLYVLAGYAKQDLSYDGAGIKPDGIIYGAGIETDIASEHVALFAEWNRHEASSTWLPVMGEITDSIRVNPSTDIVRVGVRLKLNLTSE